MKATFINSTNITASHLKNSVSNDLLRPVMNHVYVDFTEKCIVTTDAHILAMHPIEFKDDSVFSDKKGVMLPLRFFDEKRYLIDVPPLNKRVVNLEYVLHKEHAEVWFAGNLCFSCKYFEEGNYPNYIQVLPNVTEQNIVSQIGFNSKILSKIEKLIPFNIKNVKLTFFASNKAVLFESMNLEHERQIKGVVMPTLIS